MWTVDKLDKIYLDKQIKATVAFVIQASSIEGKFKLSQNRPEIDRRRIIEQLRDEKYENTSLANFMEKYAFL